MNYPKLSRRSAFAAVLEATPGAKTLPTMAANAVRLMEPPTYEEIYLAENMTDDIITGKLGVLLLASPGSRAMRITGKSPVINTGVAPAAGKYPELDAIMVAAGTTRTLDIATPGDETVTYEPNDDPSVGPLSTLCCKLQMDGKEFIVYHAVVEAFSITCDAAGFPQASWTIVGIMDPPTEKSVPDNATYNNNMFPIWKGNGSLDISNVAAGKLVPRSITFNSGVQSAPRIDANAVDGHAGYIINGRIPELDVRAEVTDIADWNPRADWNARTGVVVTALFGALQPQYNQIELKIGDGRVINVASADDNALRYFDTKYRVAMPLTGTDPEWRLTFK